SLRRSDGSGTNLGRIADKPHRWFCFKSQNAPNEYQLSASWSTTEGIWRWQRVDAAEWVHRIATYDGSSPANDPTVYENGAPVSLTRAQAPAGTYGNESLPTAIGIGNVPTFRNRTWDGLHAEFGLWNRVLTPGEAALVYLRGPLAVPDGLVCYVPLYGTQSPEPNFLSPENPGTVIGATGAAHPTIVLPWGVDLVTPPFVPSEGGQVVDADTADATEIADAAAGTAEIAAATADAVEAAVSAVATAEAQGAVTDAVEVADAATGAGRMDGAAADAVEIADAAAGPAEIAAATVDAVEAAVSAAARAEAQGAVTDAVGVTDAATGAAQMDVAAADAVEIADAATAEVVALGTA